MSAILHESRPVIQGPDSKPACSADGSGGKCPVAEWALRALVMVSGRIKAVKRQRAVEGRSSSISEGRWITCPAGAGPARQSQSGSGESHGKLAVVFQRDFLVEIEIEMVQTRKRTGRGERNAPL